MRIIIFLLALIITSNVFSGEPDEKLHKQCLYPTVIIASSEGSSGTGVIIRSEKISEKEYYNVVISCNHILSKEMHIKYRVLRGEFKNWSDISNIMYYPATICMTNDKYDLSIICFLSSTEMPTAFLGTNTKTYIGNDVIKIGCGGQEFFRLDYGKVTGLNKDVGKLPKIHKGLTRTSMYTLPGDSGGPVFQDYEFIGVINSIQTANNPLKENEGMLLEHISYFVPIKFLVEWNKENNYFDFVFDKSKPLPQKELAILRIFQYEVSQ